MYGDSLLDPVAVGLTPTCGPLLLVITPLSILSCLQLFYETKKGLKYPKNNNKKKLLQVQRSLLS